MMSSRADVLMAGEVLTPGQDGYDEAAATVFAAGRPDLGVGGLTLAGGIGWMVRRYGLAIDAVTGADMVSADGRLVRADATEHPDLLWALRGGGGNFGVVVSLDFTAQPVASVHYGPIIYRLDALTGGAGKNEADGLARLIIGWRELMRGSDESLTTALALVPPMMGRPAMVVLRCC